MGKSTYHQFKENRLETELYKIGMRGQIYHVLSCLIIPCGFRNSTHRTFVKICQGVRASLGGRGTLVLEPSELLLQNGGAPLPRTCARSAWQLDVR